jgi:hypothetical protein
VGCLLAGTGDYEKAVNTLESGLALLKECNMRRDMGKPLTGLAEAHLGLWNAEREKRAAGSQPAAGVRLEKAREALKEARSIAEEFKDAERLEEITRIEKRLNDITE